MSEVRSDSDDAPGHVLRVRRLVFDAARRADAMGVFNADEAGDLGAATVQRLARSLRAAGIARLSGSDDLQAVSPSEIEAFVRRLLVALEGSPVPKYEWRSLAGVFEPEQLAGLLGVSPSSLRRYQSGERDTPDDVAARLHYLALVVADLAGTYNEIGIRRWFDRPRQALGGKPPSALLSGEWDPEDAGAQKVRALAQSLVALSAT